MDSSKKIVAVFLPADETHRRKLEEISAGARLVFMEPGVVDLELLRGASAIIGNLPPHLLTEAKNLEWLQLSSAGVGSYGEEGMLGAGVVLTNASGAYGLAVSEYMLGVLLELLKKLHLYRDNQSAGVWHSEGQVKPIERSVVLIAGAGDIGSEFARKVKLLGAYTIGIRRVNLEKPDYLDELSTLDKLPGLLPRADVVALCLPLTQETRQVIGRQEISLMKQGSVLINVGRGGLIDTDALCDALESGRLWGAALDVFEPEPLPAGHRLWKIKNVVITPHIAGGFSLPATYERIFSICLHNLAAYVAGKPLCDVVDRGIGY